MLVKLAPSPSSEIRWRLESLDQTAAQAVRGLDIPGITVSWEHHASGSRDAIAVACKRLGVEAPEPYVPVPVGAPPFPLFPYQLDGAARINGIVRVTGGALLADDVGLGKTRQAIAVMQGLLGKNGRALIVAPASVRYSWRDELLACGVSDSDIALLVTGKEATPRARIVVSSYDLVYLPAAEAEPWRVLIIDEAHIVKGRKTKRRDALATLAAMVDYRIALTGTPVWSRPRDLYSLVRLLWPGTWGSAGAFDIAYCDGHEGTFGWENKGLSNEEELRLRLSYLIVRRTKDEVALQLPPLTRQVIWIDADDMSQAAFRQMLATGANRNGLAVALAATAKIKEGPTVEYVQQAGRPCLVYTWQREHAHRLGKALTAADVPNAVITGELSHSFRYNLIAQAKRDRATIVATLDSAYQGMNELRDVADVVVFHALDWTPLKLVQAIGRLHRIGSKATNIHAVFMAARGTADEPVVSTIIEKLEQWISLVKDDIAAQIVQDFSPANIEASETDALRAIYAAMGDEC